jgi:hypothetical protein
MSFCYPADQSAKDPRIPLHPGGALIFWSYRLTLCFLYLSASMRQCDEAGNEVINVALVASFAAAPDGAYNASKALPSMPRIQSLAAVVTELVCLGMVLDVFC